MEDTLEIETPDALADWLAIHSDRTAGLWLVTWKIAHPDRYVSRNAVLDVLVAWGWTDGRRKVLDSDRTMQWVAPRRQTVWAGSYKSRAERLLAEGRMQPPGHAALKAARASGRWTDSDSVDALHVPDDLRSGLDGTPPAAAFFDAAAPSYRRNILRWIAAAKRAPTRTKRIGIVVTASQNGDKVPQF